MIVINSPLSVPVSRNKKFILNLNNYRNDHYQVLSKAKISYKSIMEDQIKQLPKMREVEIFYRLYPKTRRLTDLDNVISIHAKFFQDALVEMEVLEEDNYLFVTGSAQSFGEVDPENPRVEIMVVENP